MDFGFRAPATWGLLSWVVLSKCLLPTFVPYSSYCLLAHLCARCAPMFFSLARNPRFLLFFHRAWSVDRDIRYKRDLVLCRAPQQLVTA